MFANLDRLNEPMRNRLKTTGMGLGLVRLLQNARRFEEAKTTLCSLENDIHGAAEIPDKPSQKPHRANRLEGVTRMAS